MSKCINYIKKIIISILTIYMIDYLFTGTNFFIPINIFTVSVVTLLNIPGLLSLIILFFIVK